MRHAKAFIGLGATTAALFAADLLTGDSPLPPSAVWGALTGGVTDEAIRAIVLSIRLTRAVVALVIGAALAVSGLQMQTVFRNPLADPYLLGVSSGAGLGVAFFILGAPLLGWQALGVWQSVGVAGAGWIGAAAVLLLVALISRRMKNILGVLIMGVMLGYIAGAVIQILQYLSSAEQLKLYFLWSMGSLGHVTAAKLWVMLPMAAAGLLLAVHTIKALNLLLLGEDYARTMGLDVRRARALIFVSTALLTGTVTAFCGPVGFLGLAVPHVARMLFREADHRILLPGSTLLGAAAMLLCDLVSKAATLPVNCVTALLGIPVIVWVIFKNIRPS